MKVYLIASLLVVSGLASAEIYRSVDSQGNVTFTDEPDKKAEKIELEELPTYEAPFIPEIPVAPAASEEQQQQDIAVPKYKISITSPEQNQSMWAGGGIVEVTATITPELNSKRGDKLQFKLDGRNIGEPQSSTSYTIDNIDRGSHILAVSVIDSSNKILKTSKSILFHIHRKSIAINGQPQSPAVQNNNSQ